MTACRSQSGLTLVEVLVALALLAALLIPATLALQTGLVGADVHADLATSHHRLRSRLEFLLTEPFTDLADAAAAAGGPSIPSSYSDAAGPPARVLVFIAPYDGDDADADGNPLTGGDEDLLWLRVEIENSVYALETVMADGVGP